MLLLGWLAGCTEVRYHVEADIFVPRDAVEEVGPGNLTLWLELEDGSRSGRPVPGLDHVPDRDVVLSGFVEGRAPCGTHDARVMATLLSLDADGPDDLPLLTTEAEPVFEGVVVCGHSFAGVELTLDRQGPGAPDGR